MTVSELRDWLHTLSPEFDDMAVMSVVQGHPFSAKRVMAVLGKESKRGGIIVNSMGEHLKEEYGKVYDFVSTLNGRLVI